MQEINFKSNLKTLQYSYDVCELGTCENRSAKILILNNTKNLFNRYHNVCVECYEKAKDYV